MRTFAHVASLYKLCNGSEFTIQLEPYCHPHPTGFSSRSSLLCRPPSDDVLSTDNKFYQSFLTTKKQKQFSICLLIDQSDTKM